MGRLLLEDVPDDLLRQLECLAEADQVRLEEETLRLLREAVGQKQHEAVLPRPERQRPVQEILDAISRNRMRPDPDGPSVVEMLREDRDR